MAELPTPAFPGFYPATPSTDEAGEGPLSVAGAALSTTTKGGSSESEPSQQSHNRTGSAALIGGVAGLLAGGPLAAVALAGVGGVLGLEQEGLEQYQQKKHPKSTGPSEVLGSYAAKKAAAGGPAAAGTGTGIGQADDKEFSPTSKEAQIDALLKDTPSSTSAIAGAAAVGAGAGSLATGASKEEQLDRTLLTSDAGATSSTTTQQPSETDKERFGMTQSAGLANDRTKGDFDSHVGDVMDGRAALADTTKPSEEKEDGGFSTPKKLAAAAAGAAGLGAAGYAASRSNDEEKTPTSNKAVIGDLSDPSTRERDAERFGMTQAAGDANSRLPDGASTAPVVDPLTGTGAEKSEKDADPLGATLAAAGAGAVVGGGAAAAAGAGASKKDEHLDALLDGKDAVLPTVDPKAGRVEPNRGTFSSDSDGKVAAAATAGAGIGAIGSHELSKDGKTPYGGHEQVEHLLTEGGSESLPKGPVVDPKKGRIEPNRSGLGKKVEGEKIEEEDEHKKEKVAAAAAVGAGGAALAAHELGKDDKTPSKQEQVDHLLNGEELPKGPVVDPKAGRVEPNRGAVEKDEHKKEKAAAAAAAGAGGAVLGARELLKDDKEDLKTPSGKQEQVDHLLNGEELPKGPVVDPKVGRVEPNRGSGVDSATDEKVDKSGDKKAVAAAAGAGTAGALAMHELGKEETTPSKTENLTALAGQLGDTKNPAPIEPIVNDGSSTARPPLNTAETSDSILPVVPKADPYEKQRVSLPSSPVAPAINGSSPVIHQDALKSAAIAGIPQGFGSADSGVAQDFAHLSPSDAAAAGVGATAATPLNAAAATNGSDTKDKGKGKEIAAGASAGAGGLAGALATRDKEEGKPEPIAAAPVPSAVGGRKEINETATSANADEHDKWQKETLAAMGVGAAGGGAAAAAAAHHHQNGDKAPVTAAYEPRSPVQAIKQREGGNSITRKLSKRKPAPPVAPVDTNAHTNGQQAAPPAPQQQLEHSPIDRAGTPQNAWEPFDASDEAQNSSASDLEAVGSGARSHTPHGSPIVRSKHMKIASRRDQSTGSNKLHRKSLDFSNPATKENLGRLTGGDDGASPVDANAGRPPLQRINSDEPVPSRKYYTGHETSTAQAQQQEEPQLPPSPTKAGGHHRKLSKRRVVPPTS